MIKSAREIDPGCTTTEAAMDQVLLEKNLIGPCMRDLGALMHAATVLVGDRLGLFRAMVDGTWVSAAELAGRTDTDTRYVAEWLAAQAASGYAEYDAHTGRFRLSEEQALVLTSEFNPMFFPGGSKRRRR
jgi:Rv2258c-like winged HTH domain